MPFDMKDMVQNIVKNVIARSDRMAQVQAESVPPVEPPPAVADVAVADVAVADVAAPEEHEDPSAGGGPPRKKKACRHKIFNLFLKPCRKCEELCNCTQSFFVGEYPDVLVRSVDKKIVRLSKYLVRASGILISMVDEALGWQRNRKGELVRENVQVEEENVIIKTEDNDFSSIVEIKRLGAGGYSRYYFDPPTASGTVRPASGTVRPAQVLYEAVQRANGDSLADLIDVESKERVLVLFDMESETPTFGISKATFKRLDYYVCTHLDEVEKRLTDQQRQDDYFANSSYFENGDIDYMDLDPKMINTFAYQDWEEEFFNVNTVEFFALSQANLELCVFDLKYAIEKWIFLGRGFPRAMVNGVYDYFEDPDHEAADIKDKRNVYGAFNIEYTNPRRRGHCKGDYCPYIFWGAKTPKWWLIKLE